MGYYFQGQPTTTGSQHEIGRGILLAILGFAFLATIAVLEIGLFPSPQVSNVVLPTETALLGAAVAYYFQGGEEAGLARLGPPPRQAARTTSPATSHEV